MKVLFYSNEFCRIHDLILESIKGHDVDTANGETVRDKIVSADVLVTRPGAPVSEELLRGGVRLKLQQQWGTGLDGIDRKACRDLGIAVCNTPSRGTGNAEGVTEIAILHMLLLCRKYAFAAENAREGRLFSPRGVSLWRKKACIVGLGNLGETIAERLAALGMTLRGVNRSPAAPSRLESMKVKEFFPLDRLKEAVKGCRFVVAALAHGPETHEIFDEAFFQSMEEGSFFINVARGGLVKEPALLQALESGRLAGAGLDVLAEEPTRPDNPLLTHPKVTLTPHIGGNTDESAKGILEFIQKNIDRLGRGESLLSRVDLPE
ncbi:MAG: 2-hydroxyacid dehydrogenase [Synergistaceae bacterium]|jgi:phosphoglycerate dehydrogenase-like enzyme|nr:2-hydroxyacid dehydrogenase [Synergistaceae bacterium]